MRYTLFLLTMFSIGPVLAEQIDDTFRIGQPFTFPISSDLEKIQRVSLTSDFTDEFKTFRDLTPDNLEKFVSANPQLFRSLNGYLYDLYRNRYLDPDQFLSLRRSVIEGLNKADLKNIKIIPTVNTHLISQLNFDPMTPWFDELREKQKTKKHRSLVALKGQRAIDMLTSSNPREGEKKPDRSMEMVESSSVGEDIDSHSEPHKASNTVFGSNLSGHHNNVSMTPTRQPIRHMKSEGLFFEGYLPTKAENLSIQLSLGGNRTHYNYGVSGSPIQKHEFRGSLLLVYGRNNVFSGEGQEIGIGLTRDQHTNNFIVLSGRSGLGTGWSVTGSYQEQISTNRQTYEASTVGWYKEEHSMATILLTKHLLKGVAISTAYREFRMDAENGDSYKFDGWYGEVGYYF